MARSGQTPWGIALPKENEKENNLDWYLHLISDRIKINADEEHIDVLVNETSGREEKANIIKVKRRKDDKWKQSI